MLPRWPQAPGGSTSHRRPRSSGRAHRNFLQTEKGRSPRQAGHPPGHTASLCVLRATSGSLCSPARPSAELRSMKATFRHPHLPDPRHPAHFCQRWCPKQHPTGRGIQRQTFTPCSLETRTSKVKGQQFAFSRSRSPWPAGGRLLTVPSRGLPCEPARVLTVPSDKGLFLPVLLD